MAKVFFLAPITPNAGLSSVCLGLLRALDSAGLRVAFFKPFGQPGSPKGQGESARDALPLSDRSIVFAREHLGLSVRDPLSMRQALRRIGEGNLPLLMEEVMEQFHASGIDGADVIIVEGLVDLPGDEHSGRLNVEVARTLNAEVILVATPEQRSPEELDELIRLAAQPFESPQDPDVVACLINKACAPIDSDYRITDHQPDAGCSTPPPAYAALCPVFTQGKLRLIGTIPWRADLVAPRLRDIRARLNATSLNDGDLDRRVVQVAMIARTLPNMLASLRSGTLIVTPGDREDILVAACMAALIGVPLAGILLTGGMCPDPRTLKLCMPAMDTGLPIIGTTLDTYHTARQLSRMDNEVPVDDFERIEAVIQAVASQIDIAWLSQRVQVTRPLRLSPAAFRYQLTQRARRANQLIVLPEGSEPRTVKAAIICHERGIARCLLLAREQDVRAVAEAQGLQLPAGLQIVDPDSIRQRYVEPMVKLRQHKGLTPQMALAQLEDTVVLGTMMLALDEVDGLVSGAIHTTANTVRPALQLIKSRPGSRVVSSVFFMCLPDQVVVYGDCAINPDPDADELADIALQCADSAQLFGIEPKVAMISYSTGHSGTGSDVDKVRAATEKARALRPSLLIDGPLQYDAAVMADVAATKAPDSPVAGKATVFVFPDLNTGNTTYKAVQRSANVVSMGPMLQGLKKPVNDLSRGALVEDIVYTIALTAVQATENSPVVVEPRATP